MTEADSETETGVVVDSLVGVSALVDGVVAVPGSRAIVDSVVGPEVDEVVGVPDTGVVESPQADPAVVKVPP